MQPKPLLQIEELFFLIRASGQEVASVLHLPVPSNYFSVLSVSSIAPSSDFISFISLLKIRIERPRERAESGKRLAPNSMRTTIRRITISLGPKFIVPTPWLMIAPRLHQSLGREK
jgi:hypothetical protein